MGRLLEDKVAVITGAATGIGRAAALVFAREGARVALADRNAQEGRATERAVQDAGGEASFLETDVCNETQVEALIDHTLSSFGALDCAFNNAGITGAMGKVQDMTLEGFQSTLEVNLLGVFLCMKHELRIMVERGSGSIVNTASGAGIIPVPALSPYCASKHAVLGLTKTAAAENAKTGVRVNAVLPGTIDTPMLQSSLSLSPEMEKMIRSAQPSGRFGRPEEVAEAACWLSSERASFVSGESMLVDGASVLR